MNLKSMICFPPVYYLLTLSGASTLTGYVRPIIFQQNPFEAAIFCHKRVLFRDCILVASNDDFPSQLLFPLESEVVIKKYIPDKSQQKEF